MTQFIKRQRPQRSRYFGDLRFNLFSTANGGCEYYIYGGNWALATKTSAKIAIDAYNKYRVENDEEPVSYRIVPFQKWYAIYIR